MKVYPIGQVQARAMPGVQLDTNRSQATPDAFGAQYGQDIQRLGGAVQRTGMIVLDEQNQAWVRDAVNNARTSLRERSDQLLTRKGKDADGISVSARDEFGKMRRQLSKDLKNPMQQQMFNAAFDQHEASHLEMLKGYEAREGERYQIQTRVAQMENEIQDAQTKPRTSIAPPELGGDPTTGATVDNWGAHKQRIVGLTTEIAQRQGFDEAQTKAAVREATTNFHRSMADHLAKTDRASEAQKYLGEHKDEIEGKVYDALKADLDQQAGSEKVYSTVVKLANDPKMTLEQRLAEVDIMVAKGRLSPNEAKEARSSLQQRAHIAEAEGDAKKAAVKRATSEGLYKWFIESKPTPDQIEARFAQLGVSGMDQLHMKDWMLQTRLASAKGVKIPTDPKTYIELNNMRRNDPQGFIKANMLDYANRLSPDDLQQFSDRQVTMQESATGKAEAKRKENRIIKLDDVAQGIVKGDESFFNPKTSDGQSNALKLATLVQKEWDALPDAERENPEAYQKIADKLSMPYGANWSVRNQPYWKAKLGGDMAEGPVERPAGVPRFANWDSAVVRKGKNGKTYEGAWVEMLPGGRKIYHFTNGDFAEEGPAAPPPGTPAAIGKVQQALGSDAAGPSQDPDWVRGVSVKGSAYRFDNLE